MVFINNNSNSGVSRIQTAGVMFFFKEEWMSDKKVFLDGDIWEPLSEAQIQNQLKDIELNAQN